MAFELNHVHVKSPDPQQTAKFYVDNLGAEIVDDIPGRGVRLNLHGLTINMTTHVADQKREQHYGMEHFALNTDEMDTALGKLTASGATILEELTSSTGRRVCFLEGPDGVQFELIQAAG